jgi:Carboxypeptidase regulatory-like domain/TonB-dependent Receptor Plug Domain
MKHPASFCRLAPLLLLAAGTLGAQASKTGTLTGTVLDEKGVPVPNVEVAVSKVARTTRTDSAGKYILALLPVGSYDVAFRRVSYAPMVFTLDISPGDTTDAEVKMNAVPQPMTRVIVEDRLSNARLEGFETRKKIGIGHYVTRAEIEARNPLQLTDIVRTIPGMDVRPDGRGVGRSTLRFTRASGKGRGGSDCPPTYFIDGTMAIGYNLDDMPVSDVEAIELYSGLSSLPSEFAKARPNLACGTVVIWTRVPNKKTK